MTGKGHGDLDAILDSQDALLGEDGSLTPTRAISRNLLEQAIAQCTPGAPPSYADRIWAELGRLTEKEEPS
jgi:hypothetical protein